MQLTDQNFQQEIEQYQGIAVVDFFAPWCGPCQLMAPMIEELIKEYQDKNIKIAKINIDENKTTAQKFNIMSIPTIYLFKNGKVIERIIGYTTKEDLKELINKYL